MNYNFPPTKWTKTAYTDEQLAHFATECREIAERIENGDFTGIVEETLDMIHSGEGFLRMAQDKHGIDVDGEIVKVIEKNKRRGYYAIM